MTGKHPRRPSLDDYDMVGSVDPDNYHQGTGSRSFGKDMRGGSQAHLRTIGGPGCWCGESSDHDWPGRAEGKPHPGPHRKEGEA